MDFGFTTNLDFNDKNYLSEIERKKIFEVDTVYVGREIEKFRNRDMTDAYGEGHNFIFENHGKVIATNPGRILWVDRNSGGDKYKITEIMFRPIEKLKIQTDSLVDRRGDAVYDVEHPKDFILKVDVIGEGKIDYNTVHLRVLEGDNVIPKFSKRAVGLFGEEIRFEALTLKPGKAVLQVYTDNGVHDEITVRVREPKYQVIAQWLSYGGEVVVLNVGEEWMPSFEGYWETRDFISCRLKLSDQNAEWKEFPLGRNVEFSFSGLKFSTDNNGNLKVQVLEVTHSPVTVEFKDVYESRNSPTIQIEGLPALIRSVKLDPSHMTVRVGDRFKINNLVDGESASWRLYWKIVSGDAISISSGSGVALRPGTAVVRATAMDGSEQYDECTITVLPALNNEVTLNTDRLSKYVGESYQLIASIGGEQSNNVRWSVEGGDEVRVSDTGLVEMLRPGVAWVRATSTDGSGKYAQCLISVRFKPIKFLVVKPGNVSCRVGETTQLLAYADGKVSADVRWSIASGNAVTVSRDGRVTAVAPGTAKVRASYPTGIDMYVESTITVYPPVITNLTLSTGNVSARVGEGTSLKAYADGTATNDVRWTVVKGDAVTVSSDGRVTAVAAGTATVRATYTDDSGKYAECTVKVSPKVEELRPGQVVYYVEVNGMNDAYAYAGDRLFPNIRWSVKEGASYITITEDGSIRGIREGSAVILGQATDGSGRKIEVPVNVFRNVAESYVVVSSQDKSVKMRIEAKGDYVVLGAKHNAATDRWEIENPENELIIKGNVTGIDFQGSKINTINLSIAPMLRWLKCMGVGLKELNLSGALALGFLWCNDNELTELNVAATSGIYNIDCANNNFSVDEMHRILAALPRCEPYPGTMIITNYERYSFEEIKKAVAKGWIVKNWTREKGHVSVYPLVKINASTRDLRLGESGTLSVSVDGEASNRATLSVVAGNALELSSDGRFEAVRVGTAVVRATAPGESGAYAEVAISVRPREISALTLSKSNVALQVGERTQLLAYADGHSTTGVRWSVVSGTAASVSSEGEVTAEAAGTATVRATATDGSGKYAECTIEVKAPVAVRDVKAEHQQPVLRLEGHTLIIDRVASGKTVRVRDLSGRLLHQMTSRGAALRIDLLHLPQIIVVEVDGATYKLVSGQ